MAVAKTDTIIKTEGMEALISRLGHVDAERFIVLLSKEPFDYTEWRKIGLEQDVDVATLSQRAEAFSKTL